MARRTTLTLSMFASFAALYVGCTQDFERFNPDNGFTTGPGSGSSSGQTGSGGSTGCTADSECNDFFSCTKDTCDIASAKCAFTSVADGPVPGIDDIPTDCKDRVCEAGVEKEPPDDTEAPADDMNPCKNDTCSGGNIVSENAPANTKCGAGDQLFCDGMGACVGCTMPGQCPGAPECQESTCQQQVCGTGNLPMGTPCNGGKCDGAGQCAGCLGDVDCNGGVSEICVGQSCILSCPDGAKNGLETDTDCGGGFCAGCGDGKLCNTDGDCANGSCIQGVCAQPTCTDNIKNGQESDVDCGAVCPMQCTDGQACGMSGDCVSTQCAGNTCISCNDGETNGSETDSDCGGGTCPPCGDNKMCLQNADCMSGNCPSGVCVSMQCSNMMQDGNETDVDCGGGMCPGCAPGEKCKVNSDCASNSCKGNGTCNN